MNNTEYYIYTRMGKAKEILLDVKDLKQYNKIAKEQVSISSLSEQGCVVYSNLANKQTYLMRMTK